MSFNSANVEGLNQFLPLKATKNKNIAVMATRDQKYINIWNSQNSSPVPKNLSTQETNN